MDYKAYFKGKKVTLMRIGLLGRGVGDAATLAECGADVLVVDDAPQEVMQPSVDKLKKYKNIKFKFGPYDINDFRNCDFVLKGAGTPLDSPEIAEARKYGIPVEMSASLFMKLANIPVIGITGTRGKSTVTHLIYHILGVAKKKVLLGGNVVGVSTLALLPKAKSADYAVFELDSWQLQGFGDSELSPKIAVFTTFMDDHLAYYKGDRSLYFKDKANIFMYQKEGDWCVLGKQVAPMIKEFKGNFITAPTSLLLIHKNICLIFKIEAAITFVIRQMIVHKSCEHCNLRA
jgi:UDP-N-acetylmuramoylalanine--D-glutamate ligase